MTKSSTVVIGCKLPNGLILEIGAPGQSGYRKQLIKGANEGHLTSTGLFVPATKGGFGRTTVDAAFWEAWKSGEGLRGVGTKDQTEAQATQLAKANRKAQVDEWQASGVLFVADSDDLALAQANEKAAARTGFEPLNTGKDSRAANAQDIEANPDELAARRRDNFGAAQA